MILQNINSLNGFFWEIDNEKKYGKLNILHKIINSYYYNNINIKENINYLILHKLLTYSYKMCFKF